MRIIFMFLSVIIIGFTGCNILKNSISTGNANDDKILFHSKNYFIDSNKVTFIECNEFVSNALVNYNIAIIKRIFLLDCSVEPVINMHETSYVDTVYKFFDSNNKIQVYRAKDKEFVIYFDVSDSKYTLNGNVKTGMTKEVFIQKFQINKSISDVVKVANTGSSMKFIFYFKNNRLERIKSDLYLD